MAIERVRTYIHNFDEYIQGGVPKGHVILIAGTPGTMKSSVCYSILYQNAKHNGTRSVYMTLEQSKENLLQQMEFMGMNDPEVQEKVHILDLATIRKNVTEMMAKGSWLQVFKMYAEAVRKDVGYDLLVVDSLDVLEMAAQMNSDRRNDLFYLFMWLRGMSVTSFLISETSVDTINGGRFEEGYLADGVISLKLQSIGETDVQRRIRAVKLRSTNHKTGYFSLMFSDGTFRATQVINE
ncbi:MAG TPA: RAD55 family ATPase [Methanomassiliicoccales archaeon]|jgi:circadian clock protein KaiC|nr:RAD55 family ATPase [Euryarchaeota archaeon]HOE52424.1 RAD55 family ATPase [Methanomassiliicoccales archaeon]HQM66493.1 RAD55 family ATPase [Methanomassiliicoccales archaeon]